MLHALASCLTTSIVAHAAVRGIAIEELESELEGDIDLNGFLGLDAGMPKGFTEIRARFRVKADPKDMDNIKQLAMFSPVFNTITESSRVDVDVVMK
ncbi:OsmC family protein [Pseudomonadota bacterium]